MADREKILDEWKAALKTWLETELAGVAGFPEIVEAQSGVERPLPGVVVVGTSAKRVRDMLGTAEIVGSVLLRSHLVDTAEAAHKAWAADLEEKLKGLEDDLKPGPLTGLYLHKHGRGDLVEGVDGDDRVSGWPLEVMATQCE